MSTTGKVKYRLLVKQIDDYTPNFDTHGVYGSFEDAVSDMNKLTVDSEYRFIAIERLEETWVH